MKNKYLITLLAEEVKTLEQTIETLYKQLAAAKDVLDGLQKTLYAINEDLDHKNSALQLDRQCMETRKRVAIPSLTETDKNLLLTGIDAETTNNHPSKYNAESKKIGTGIYDSMFNSTTGTMRETMGSAGGFRQANTEGAAAFTLKDTNTLSGGLSQVPTSTQTTRGHSGTLKGAIANKATRTVDFA